MVRIGLVGGVKKYHGMTFAEMLNGYDREKAEAKSWAALYTARVGLDATVTHIWDESLADAREVAGVCGIRNVAGSHEEMIGKVDAIILPDDCTLKHQRLAIPFIKAGIPTFIDKPFATSVKDADALINLSARHKAPIMSCSCLRYAREVKECDIGAIGEIQTGYSISWSGMGTLLFYGIHAFELLISIVGPGLVSVRNIGNPKENMLAVTFKDGRRFVVCAYESIKPLFQVNLYGDKGSCSINVTDFDYAYSEMLRRFVMMVESGRPAIPLEETREIIESLCQAEESAGSNLSSALQ